MPINRLLKDKRTPEEIEFLNNAFNHTLNLLGVVDRNAPLCDMIARKVIEVGATGISEPREIAEMAGQSPGAGYDDNTGAWIAHCFIVAVLQKAHSHDPVVPPNTRTCRLVAEGTGNNARFLNRLARSGRPLNLDELGAKNHSGAPKNPSIA